MKKELNGLEINCIVKELQALCESKLSRIYQKNKDLYFQFFKSGGKKHLLRITPSFIYITSSKPKAEQSNFCMFLRRRLENGILKQIEQKDLERVVLLTFNTKEKDYILIAELFSKGNVILCDKDLTIISPMKTQKWKDRVIVPKVKYVFPISKIPNLKKIDSDKLFEILNESKKTLVKKLATELFIGGLVAEEICELTKLEKNSTEVNKEDCKKIVSAIKKIFGSEIKAFCTKETVMPFGFETVNEEGKKDFDSFNSALDFFLTNQGESEEKEAGGAVYNKELEKLDNIIELQTSNLKKIINEIDENRKKADLIYENYSFVKDVLTTIKNARNKKISWEEIKEKLSEKEIEVMPKEGKVIVKLAGH